LFLLLLVVMDDAADLLNSGAFAWAGDEYVIQGRTPPAHPMRIVGNDVGIADRTTLIVKPAAAADDVGRRRDSIPSHTRAPRARSYIASPAEDASASTVSR
jgi:hypothetical protein